MSGLLLFLLAYANAFAVTVWPIQNVFTNELSIVFAAMPGMRLESVYTASGINLLSSFWCCKSSHFIAVFLWLYSGFRYQHSSRLTKHKLVEIAVML